MILLTEKELENIQEEDSIWETIFHFVSYSIWESARSSASSSVLYSVNKCSRDSANGLTQDSARESVMTFMKRN